MAEAGGCLNEYVLQDLGDGRKDSQFTCRAWLVLRVDTHPLISCHIAQELTMLEKAT